MEIREEEPHVSPTPVTPQPWFCLKWLCWRSSVASWYPSSVIFVYKEPTRPMEMRDGRNRQRRQVTVLCGNQAWDQTVTSLFSLQKIYELQVHRIGLVKFLGSWHTLIISPCKSTFILVLYWLVCINQYSHLFIIFCTYVFISLHLIL